MKIEQFVMAYKVEQDKIRAMLPKGFASLRPVMRINAEIRGTESYIEFNTPVTFKDKRGWLNIDKWDDNIQVGVDGNSTTFKTDFLDITYIGVGTNGSCPAESDNDGCFFYIGEKTVLVPPEVIHSNKEFCDCIFKWTFDENDAHGESYGGKTLPAIHTAPVTDYAKQKFTAKVAAAIPCEQMLGQYKVVFDRNIKSEKGQYI